MSNVSSYIGELYHLVYSWYNKNRKLRCTNGPAVIGATGTHSVGIVMVSATAQMALLLFMQMVNRDGILMVSATAQMALLLFMQMVNRDGIVMAKTSLMKLKHGWRQKVSLGPGILQLKQCLR